MSTPHHHRPYQLPLPWTAKWEPQEIPHNSTKVTFTICRLSHLTKRCLTNHKLMFCKILSNFRDFGWGYIERTTPRLTPHSLSLSSFISQFPKEFCHLYPISIHSTQNRNGSFNSQGPSNAGPYYWQHHGKYGSHQFPRFGWETYICNGKTGNPSAWFREGNEIEHNRVDGSPGLPSEGGSNQQWC